MDREGPETLARQGADAEPIETSVTAGAAARVAVILQKAEARAAAIAEEAERDGHRRPPRPPRSEPAATADATADESEAPAAGPDRHAEGRPEPFDGPLPDGAPMARRPARDADARFAAVLMAIQGQDREQV